jgi:hypothetical protein
MGGNEVASPIVAYLRVLFPLIDAKLLLFFLIVLFFWRAFIADNINYQAQ